MTLLRLLVILVVISVLVTVAWDLHFISSRPGGCPKSSGRITQGALAKARVLAAERQVTHFLVFINAPALAPSTETGSLEVHLDANADGRYQPGVDPLVDGALRLVNGNRFRMPGGARYPSALSPAWLAFRPDGSFVPDGVFFPSSDVPGSQFDAAFGAGRLTWSTSDLCIEPSNGNRGKVYFDLVPSTGKARKLIYLDH